MAAAAPAEEGDSWQKRLRALKDSPTGRRLRQVAGLHLRQLPCIHSVLPNFRCCKRKSYQTLGQDEEGDGAEVEDRRQYVNRALGQMMVRAAVLTMCGITVMLIVRGGALEGDRGYSAGLSKEQERARKENEFQRDKPVVLYIAGFELLVCGACAHTAAMMYKRRRHALRHPADSTGRERQLYTKVHLEKSAGMEDRQLFGVGFRPSSDGLECLIIETIRRGTLLDKWNQRVSDPTPEALVEEALGGDSFDKSPTEPAGEGSDPTPANPTARPQQPQQPQQVWPGCAIVAVNDVTADVGMMQLQLTKPKVTLWIRPDMTHPSQLESEVLASPREGDLGPGPPGQNNPHIPPPDYSAQGPGPTFFGRAEGSAWSATAAARVSGLFMPGPRCACLTFEDEEPQILHRWMVCGIVFGWVTMLPVLLMQPHEERPRQQLFRQYMLKPCLLIMPIWIILWLLDCIEVLFFFQIMPPLFYFGVCHMLMPAVLVWYMFQMQAADEVLVLEQRSAREKEAGCTVPVVAEDPAPTFLQELISVNPVALIWIGACASVPLLVASLLTPMKTERAKMAQGYVHIIYAPCVFLQVAFALAIYSVSFIDLPGVYLGGIGMLLGVPCFAVWCLCLVCASSYGRKDVFLVQKQRRDRAKEAMKALQLPVVDDLLAVAAQLDPGLESSGGLVDCTEAQNRDWQLVLTA